MEREVNYKIEKLPNGIEIKITLEIHSVGNKYEKPLAQAIIYGGFLNKEGYEFDITEGEYPCIIAIFKSVKEIKEAQLLVIKKQFEKQYLALKEPVRGYIHLIKGIVLEQVKNSDAINAIIKGYIDKYTETKFEDVQEWQENAFKEINEMSDAIKELEKGNKKDNPPVSVYPEGEIPEAPNVVKKMISFSERFKKCWSCMAKKKIPAVAACKNCGSDTRMHKRNGRYCEDCINFLNI